MSSKKFGKYIAMIMKYTHSYLDKELKDVSIGRGEFSHLMHLYEKDSVSQDYLAKKICVDKGSTAKVIKSLLKSGYISRELDPSDKRAKLITLTDQAWELKKEMTNILKEWDKIVKKDISQEDYDIFYKVSMKMAENAKEHYDEKYKGD